MQINYKLQVDVEVEVEMEVGGISWRFVQERVMTGKVCFILCHDLLQIFFLCFILCFHFSHQSTNSLFNQLLNG
jgi:hypothetical protein